MTRHWIPLIALLVACKGKDAGDDTGKIAPADVDGDGYTNDVDCDDYDASVHPGADEVCNGIDDDCDGSVDEDPALGFAFYEDADGDGYGDASTEVVACDPPSSSSVLVAGDCDDSAASVHPGASETCNDVDDDCDGDIDEYAIDALPWYTDADGDGYGDNATMVLACEQPSGTVANNGDCDDAHAEAHPGGEEVCDSLDNDCDGTVDFEFTVGVHFPTIQDAIDAASDGDIVCVPPGDYPENVDFLGKNVEVYGYGGAEQTAITGDGTGPVVTIASGEGSHAWLHGFTITGGASDAGAGIYVEASQPTLEDLVVEGNTCASPASGACKGAGVALVDAAASLSKVEIRDNTAEADEVCGGGLYVGITSASGSSAVSPELTDVSLLDNSAVAIGNLGAGGGACFEWPAGLYNLYPTWDGGTVAGNTVENGSTAAVGGGIALVGDGYANIQAMHLFVADNVATGFDASGGGLGHHGDGSGAWVQVYNSVFANNAATGETAVGGGVGLGTYANLNVIHADFVGNEAATAGGAVGFAGVDYAYGDITAANLVSNDAPDGSAFGWVDDPAYFQVGYSNLYDNAAPEATDPTRVYTYASIAADPLYLDTSAASAVDWDLHLDPSSPSVDPTDYYDYDVDGTPGDIGAYGGSYGAGYHDHWN